MKYAVKIGYVNYVFHTAAAAAQLLELLNKAEVTTGENCRDGEGVYQYHEVLVEKREALTITTLLQDPITKEDYLHQKAIWDEQRAAQEDSKEVV